MASKQRVRTRGSFESTSTLQHWVADYNCARDTIASDSAVPAVKVGVVETMSDIVDPSFKRRQGRGEVFFNPLLHTKVGSRLDIAGSGYNFRNTTLGCSVPSFYQRPFQTGVAFPNVVNVGANKAVLVSGSLFSQEEIRAMEDEVSTKCQAKRGMSDSNLFESLAEYRQTIQLLRNPLGSLWNFLAKNASGIKRANAVGSAWLSYRYGVRPIISDVEGIISGMKQKIGKMRITTRASANSSRARVVTATRTNGAGVIWVWSITTHSNIQVRAMSLDEYIVGRAERVGFTGKGLLTTPWELVPYSFVADWFVNFGDFLKAIVPLPSLNQLGSCITTHVADSHIYDPLSTGHLTWTLLTATSGRCSSTNEVKIRKPIWAPSIVVKSDFRLTDAVRIADSVSLLGQRLASLFGRR